MDDKNKKKRAEKLPEWMLEIQTESLLEAEEKEAQEKKSSGCGCKYF